jgi:hypothetical protein
MKMRNLIMDTSDLSFEELDTLIQQLRKARERKGEARARYQNFSAMIENMREENLVFCSKHTGEILNPNDWVVYDNLNHSAYPETNEEE